MRNTDGGFVLALARACLHPIVTTLQSLSQSLLFFFFLLVFTILLLLYIGKLCSSRAWVDLLQLVRCWRVSKTVLCRWYDAFERDDSAAHNHAVQAGPPPMDASSIRRNV